MRNLFERLFGNNEQKKTLANMIENGTFPHAMILDGPTGSGKHLLAEEIAASLLCHNRKNTALPLPCGICPACQKIKARQCPDLTYVTPEEGKTQITVEKIRSLRADMVLAANDSDHKIYIVEGADTMNAAAQNALLISLEEPPKGVIILLLCEQLEKLLPTVKSRCQILRTELFEPEEIDVFLRNEKNAEKLKRESPERYAALLESSHGSIGTALRYLEGASLNKILKQREVVDGLLTALTENRFSAIYTAFSALPTEKRSELSDILSLLFEAVRDLVLLKRAEGVKLCYFYDRESALSTADRIGIRRLLHFSEILEGVLYDLSRNANTQLLIHTMISVLHRAL